MIIYIYMYRIINEFLIRFNMIQHHAFPSLRPQVIFAPGTPEMHARRAEGMWRGMSSEDHDDL